ncbi:MAG: glucose 1-dehydrogenase [Ruminococcaceae bacterium]|nr:glucose 1-dehydrogenase [Oscillospiraceae bacterium]
MDKRVLITGASRGIGAACAERFGTAGYAVSVHYHKNRDAAEAVCQKISSAGGKAQAFCADLADEAQIAALAKAVGPVDVLVNNAGIALFKMLCDTTAAEWDRLFAVNLRGMMLLTQALLPHMVHIKSGSIVNLSSIWGLTGASCEVAYSASKAAVIGFTKALAKELGPSGIRVNCVAPGVIETDMNANLDAAAKAALCEETPLGRTGTPQEVAEAVFYLSDSTAAFITGQVLSPNGGLIM